jgi:hypothetical protein
LIQKSDGDTVSGPGDDCECKKLQRNKWRIFRTKKNSDIKNALAHFNNDTGVPIFINSGANPTTSKFTTTTPTLYVHNRLERFSK